MLETLLTQQVLDRLDRLERANRRYRLALAGAALLCFGWAACSLAPQTKNSLSAERFVLVGADGTERATLELDAKGNPMLQMRNGEASALLTTNGPSLLLRGPDGKTGAFIGIDGQNTSRVDLTSQRLMDGVRLRAHPDGSAGVYVLDVTGRERGSLESFAPGGSALTFRDGQGKLRSHLGLDEGNLPSLILLDEKNARRIGMVVQADGNGLLEMSDGKGQPRAALETLFDGSGRMSFKREDGSVTFQSP